MIPFAPPHIDQAIIDEVVDTLKSGWITTGPKTKLFEKKLAAYCGNPNTLCLNSATAGLEIMLRWFGVKEGDEVILPAYTYSATANVIMHVGAKPVFVDVKDDFNIDPIEIEKHITTRTKVIMPVDFGGLPCDYDLINELTIKYKNLFAAENDTQKKLGRILVLSDAAHSIGATLNNKHTGVLTDVSVFSFHAVKNLTTAEGGAIALNLPEPFSNQEIYDMLCVKTLHGQNKDALAKSKPGNWKYDIVEPGYKMNMTDIQASMGLVELARYDSLIFKRRKEICLAYSKAFESFDWAITPTFKTVAKESSYHLYPLRIKNCTAEQRDQIIAKIFEKQVSVNVHFIPVPMMSFYRSLGYNMANYPNTYHLFEQEISLPVFMNITSEQIELVQQAVIQSVYEVMGV